MLQDTRSHDANLTAKILGYAFCIFPVRTDTPWHTLLSFETGFWRSKLITSIYLTQLGQRESGFPDTRRWYGALS